MHILKKILPLALCAVMLLSLTACSDPVPPTGESEMYFADIVVKDYGTITVELDGPAAPITVNNFVKLAQEGFYNGTTFHRIIKDFGIQGGDPTGTGRGGSEEKITGEFESNGIINDLSHTRGVISMARPNQRNGATSQFFILQTDSTYLDGDYAAFGYVTSGIEIVDALCDAAEPIDDNGGIAPEAQPVIESITIYQ